MNDEPTIEVIGQAAPPRLSEEGIAYQRGLLVDPQWVAQFPQHAAMIQRTLDEALAATGHVDPPADTRSPAQRLHDRQLGVEPRTSRDYDIDLPPGFKPAEGASKGEVVDSAKELLAGLQIDPVLGRAVMRDILSNPETPNPAQVARQLDAIGVSYDAAIKDANYALEHAGQSLRAGMQIKATDLPPWALAQLAIWGRRLQQHASGRPQ